MGWGVGGGGLPEALRCYLVIHVIYTELAIEPSLGEALRFSFGVPCLIHASIWI